MNSLHWGGSCAPDGPAQRRIAAIVLPELACEIATSALGVCARETPGALKAERLARLRAPLAAVLCDQAARSSTNALKASSKLDGVNDTARQFGVREGQSIAEACAIVAHLIVREVTTDQVRSTLGRIAEVALAFGPTVAIELPQTVWVDITGAAHLQGGEAAVAAELVSRVRALGHVARVAVASGPRLAQAFARFAPGSKAALGEPGSLVIRHECTKDEFARLPLNALPLEPDCASWLMRLGVLTVADLSVLPRAALAARLGESACQVLDMCAGRDFEPLARYEPPKVLVEETSWDDTVSGVEPLLFVLRGLAARMSARLVGRGEAAQKLTLIIDCDRSTARLNAVPPQIKLAFDLAAPLWREQELRRVIAARLERQRLEAPSTGLHLEASALTPLLGRQLDLSRVSSGMTSACRGLEELPVLLAELAADIGKEHVGVFAVADSHKPEAQSVLVPALTKTGNLRRRFSKRRLRNSASVKPPEAASSQQPQMRWPNAPTRLLPRPVRIDAAICVGATLAIDHQLYSIERIQFEKRLDSVEWWSRSAATRDYLRLWLARPEGGLEAIVYVDRKSGARFLQGIAD